jgi:translation initiation factor 2 beta subunit (eIF-2beta)/eIF-5
LRIKFQNKRKDWKPSLAELLDFVIDTKVISNDGFSVWHRHNYARAYSRYKQQKIQEMNEKGLTSIDLNEDEVEIIDEDKNHDYVKLLKKSLLGSRNDHAHGSTTLHNKTLGTIHIISEIINQIYTPQQT